MRLVINKVPADAVNTHTDGICLESNPRTPKNIVALHPTDASSVYQATPGPDDDQRLMTANKMIPKLKEDIRRLSTRVALQVGSVSFRSGCSPRTMTTRRIAQGCTSGKASRNLASPTSLNISNRFEDLSSPGKWPFLSTTRND